MRRLVCNIISVIFSFFRFFLLKIFHFKTFHCSFIERFSPNVVVEMNRRASFDIGEKVRVHSGCKIKIRSGAKVKLETGVKINYNCIIIAKESIQIGEGTEFGPGVLVYDHDHDFRAVGGLKASQFKTSPVSIGRNVWIGANTVILRGTKIGDGAVIGAGCVINGVIPPRSVVVQTRDTRIEKIEEKNQISSNEKR